MFNIIFTHWSIEKYILIYLNECLFKLEIRLIYKTIFPHEADIYKKYKVKLTMSLIVRRRNIHTGTLIC